MDKKEFLQYLKKHPREVIFSYKGDISGETEYFVYHGTLGEDNLEGVMVTLSSVSSIYLDALLEREDLRIVDRSNFKPVGDLVKKEQ